MAIIIALNKTNYEWQKFYGHLAAFFPRITPAAAADLSSVSVSASHRFFTLGGTASSAYGQSFGLQEAIGTDDNGSPTAWNLPPGHSYKVVLLAAKAQPDITYSVPSKRSLPRRLAANLANQLGRGLLNGDLLDALSFGGNNPLTILPQMMNDAVRPITGKAFDYLGNKLGFSSDDDKQFGSEPEYLVVICMPNEYPQTPSEAYQGSNQMFNSDNSAQITGDNNSVDLSTNLDNYNYYQPKLADHLNVVFNPSVNDDNRQDKKDFLGLISDALDVMSKLADSAVNFGDILKGLIDGAPDDDALQALIDLVAPIFPGLQEMQAEALEQETALMTDLFKCKDKSLACIMAESVSPAVDWVSLFDRYFLDPNFADGHGLTGSLAWKTGNSLEITTNGSYWLS